MKLAAAPTAIIEFRVIKRTKACAAKVINALCCFAAELPRSSLIFLLISASFTSLSFFFPPSPPHPSKQRWGVRETRTLSDGCAWIIDCRIGLSVCVWILPVQLAEIVVSIHVAWLRLNCRQEVFLCLIAGRQGTEIVVRACVRWP